MTWFNMNYAEKIKAPSNGLGGSTKLETSFAQTQIWDNSHMCVHMGHTHSLAAHHNTRLYEEVAREQTFILIIMYNWQNENKKGYI